MKKLTWRLCALCTKDLSGPQIWNISDIGGNWPIAMWIMPTPTPLSGTSTSQRRRRTTSRLLPTLRALTPAKMKKKLKKPTLKFQNRDLSQPEVMAPFHLLGPALLKPTSPLLQLYQPAALLPLQPLDLCSIKNFKLYQIPGMPGADAIYTLFPFGLLPEQVLTWFACL
jgi:hypothetical protein